MNKDQIEFNKTLTKNRKEAAVKLCLWGDDEISECSPKIIAAHSIQRGKILSSIADSGRVYYLGLEPSDGMTGLEPVFKKEGIKKFSTFSGFCGEHDKKIFQPIEDKSFDGTKEQMNIYAYRATTKELHANLESCQLMKNLLGDKLEEDDFPPHFQATLPAILEGKMVVPDFIKEGMIEGYKNEQLRVRLKSVELNISELRLLSNHLKSVIQKECDSEFEHKYYQFSSEYPIACCSNFIPYFDHDGNQILDQKVIDKLAHNKIQAIADSKSVSLNIFPENECTHVLFSFSKNNTEFKSAIEKLFDSDTDSIKVGLSNMIFNYVENIALKPTYVEDRFDNHEHDSIRQAYANNIVETDLYTKVGINLFRQ